jgi:isocitrate dehydrogenase kinase/phosphatase
MSPDLLSAPETDPDTLAQWIVEAYRAYRRDFRALTRRARRHFEDRAWSPMQADVRRRLEIYQRHLEALLRRLPPAPAPPAQRPQWRRTKGAFAARTAGWPDRGMAETFFNSVSRRHLQVVGVDAAVEFVRADRRSAAHRPEAGRRVRRAHPIDGDLAAVFQRVLARAGFRRPFRDLPGAAARLAEAVSAQRAAQGKPRIPERIEMIRQPFFRGVGAYLIGRLRCAEGVTPLAVALLNEEGRLEVDGLILDEDGVRLLFSYTHTYFHVDVSHVTALVAFLRSLMPGKRPAEIYISLGYHRHGKTELYRDLVRQQVDCRQRFQVSPGKRGMVMEVFNRPDDDLVFKLIKDRRARAKPVSRRQIRDKYAFIFRSDRAGRLLDTQAFEQLKIRRACFTPALLTELQRNAAEGVVLTARHVILHFVYVERRVTPLDIFLAEADARRARATVIDFGNAIKDLARSNIFPGDMLLKNFGVTRLGRVVFYDYDEVCPLTSCRFRETPAPRHPEDEMMEEPFYFVDDNDVFPAELARFLGLADHLRRVFLEQHGDLFEVDFWRQTQAAVREGFWLHVFPYRRMPRTHA